MNSEFVMKIEVQVKLECKKTISCKIKFGIVLKSVDELDLGFDLWVCYLGSYFDFIKP